MGWLKKAVKSVYKAIDPLVPESEKKTDDKILSALGVKGAVPGQGANKPQGSSASTTPTETASPAALITGISQEEAESLSSKRLARLGRYFTSPLGVLSGASTGSQKVFS